MLILLSGSNAFPEDKKKVTLFPFNDLSRSTLDLQSTSIISSELRKNDLVEVVPPEVVRQQVYTVEPAFLWGDRNNEKGGRRNRGGMAWRIEPAMIQTVSRDLSSDYSIYGDETNFDGRWTITAYIADSEMNVLKAFTVNGKGSKEKPNKLLKLAKDISAFFGKDQTIESCEEIMRKYLGRIYPLHLAIKKVEAASAEYPELIQLRVILLDLYMNDKVAYKEKIISSASKIIRMYDPSDEDSTRYLLSRTMDPYDILAEQYEQRGDLQRAIQIREQALVDFDFYADKHKKAIGKAEYNLGLRYESRKERARAVEAYRKALSYLRPETEEAQKSTERLKVLENK